MEQFIKQLRDMSSGHAWVKDIADRAIAIAENGRGFDSAKQLADLCAPEAMDRVNANPELILAVKNAVFGMAQSVHHRE